MTEKAQHSPPLFYDFDEVKSMLHQELYPVVVAGHENPDQPLHAHNFIEIVIVNKGHGIHLLEEQRHSLVVGDVFVVPRGIRHGYVNEGQLAITNVLFQMSTIDHHFPEIKSLQGFFSFFMADTAPKRMTQHVGRLLNLNREELAHVKDLQNKIGQEQRESLSGTTSMCLLYLAQILIYLSRLLEMRKRTHCLTDSLLQFSRVYKHINQHFREKITIAELAGVAGMSPRNFQRLFAQINRLTPSNYILEKRLEKSRELLKNTSLDIGRVAIESGFKENSYFSKTFKQRFGISPRQFRNVITKRTL
jgi:AraC-like DNA-binding protein/mannose-6-phosphate isomerase-like protein (cupin superfamily)